MKFKVDFDFFNECISILKDSCKQYATIAEVIGINCFYDYDSSWGKLHNLVINLWKDNFKDKEKCAILTYFLMNCMNQKDIEQDSILGYEIHTSKPKIGKLVSSTRADFDPDFYFTTCQLEKPGNVDWTHYLWEVLTRDYDGDN